MPSLLLDAQVTPDASLSSLSSLLSEISIPSEPLDARVIPDVHSNDLLISESVSDPLVVGLWIESRLL